MYGIGELVKISGYGACAIKSDSVQRVIVDSCEINNKQFYRCANGTNTSGISYHWYHEGIVKLVNPPVVKPVEHGKITRLRVRSYTSSKPISKLCRPRKAA